MKKINFLILVLFLLSKSVSAQYGYLGEMRLTSFNFAPKGWLKCEGQLLPINQNQALFSILGTTYGGNGTTNFALPDYRGRAAVGVSSLSIQGTKAGAETVSLTAANLPAHNHVASLKVSSAPATLHVPTATSVIAAPALTVNGTAYPIAGFNSVAPNVALAGAESAAVGSAVPINISQPSLPMTYIICIQGIYPSQN